MKRIKNMLISGGGLETSGEAAGWRRYLEK